MTDTVEVAELPAVTGAGETALAETSKPAGVVFAVAPVYGIVLNHHQI